MTAVRHPFALIRRAALPALGLLIICYFLGAAVAGENGVLAWGDYRRAKAERSVTLARLETQRDQLSRHARLLDPARVDPDFAEEMVRRRFGYVRPDEIVIPVDEPPATRPAAARAR